MPDAPDVKVKITAEDQGVASAIKQLTSQLKTLKDQEKETADASLNLKDAFTGIIEVLAVEKFAEFGKEVFDTTTKILKLSQVTGLSTETISVYASAATDAGVSFDQVGAGISKLALVVTQFEQGNQKAAKAIALTGLSLKSFTGLNAEQKIRLITDAIGKMPAGFQKQTVETKLLGDTTGSLTKVFNSLAGDGFEKTREEAEKLGNIVGTQTAVDFEALRSAIADMKEASEGVVRQFEAGLVPSLTDVANAILRATTQDGTSGFKRLGEFAGGIIKSLVYGLTLIAVSFGEVFGTASFEVENFATFLKEVATKGYAEARRNFEANNAADKVRLDGFLNAKLDAVAAELDGESRLQKAANDKAAAEREKNKGKEKPIQNEEEIKGLLKLEAQRDAAFKARTASLNKALQAEGEIRKAFDAEHAEDEKSAFERGLISLTDYHADRRDSIAAAGLAELAELTAQRANEVKAAARAASELAANQGKSKKAGGVDTIVGQEYQAAAARNLADQQRAKQAIADLDTKINIQISNNREKLTANALAQFKSEAEQKTKLAGFQKTILDIQGKTSEAAKIEADAKEAEYRLLLTSKEGETPESIEEKVKAYRDLTAAAGEYEDKRKEGEAALKSLTDARAEIEDQVRSGKIFQLTAAERIEDLQKKELANLQKIAAAQLAAAQATGNKADIAQAKDFQRQVNTIAIESQSALTDAAKIKAGIQESLVGSFQNFFDSGVIGARNVGQAFAGLADGIVGSLRKVASQMLTNIIMTKLFKSISGAATGGGLGGGIASFFGFDEGGMVNGPAGTDVIPARLTAGEFVFKESAVRAIGPDVLAAMNRGLRAPSFSVGGVARFAEGGLVEGPGQGGGAATHNLIVGLEEGIVLKHMNSRGAGKIVVQHLANNPKQASAAIGRSK